MGHNLHPHGQPIDEGRGGSPGGAGGLRLNTVNYNLILSEHYQQCDFVWK